MRKIIFFVVSVVVMLPLPSAAQTLSPRMADVLRQEGQIEHFILSSSQARVFVSVGPETRKDREAILTHCQAVLEELWPVVERQYGYDEALLKNKNALAATVDFLTKARKSPQALAELQRWRAQFEWDSNGSGRMLKCMLGKALEMAGGRTPTVASPRDPPSPASLSDATRAAAIQAYRAEWAAFRERFPFVSAWTQTEINQYRLFMGTNALEILNRHKAKMATEDYDAIAKPGIEMQDQGRAACPTCKAEYPARKMVAGLDTPSASFQPQYKSAQDNYASNAELDSAMQQLANNASNPSGTTMGAFAGALTNAGKPALVHNRANDATACIRVEPTGAQMEWGIEGRYRLRNSCGYPIAASWCANAQECGAGRGNLWTIAPGKDYPIYFADTTNPNIQVGACKAGDARQPPLGQQGVERTGFSSARDQPTPAAGVSLLPKHRCE